MAEKWFPAASGLLAWGLIHPSAVFHPPSACCWTRWGRNSMGEGDTSVREGWELLHLLCPSSVSPFKLSLSTHFPPDTKNHKDSQVHPLFVPTALPVVHTLVLNDSSRCPIPLGSSSFPPMSPTMLVPLHPRRTSPRGRCSSRGRFPWTSLFHWQQSISPRLGMYLLIGT